MQPTIADCTLHNQFVDTIGLGAERTHHERMARRALRVVVLPQATRVRRARCRGAALQATDAPATTSRQFGE
jgi:hypothetical protein